MQQWRQWSAGPLGVADGATEKVESVVPGAFQCEKLLAALACFNLIYRQRLRTRYKTSDIQTPRGLVQRSGLAIVVDIEEAFYRCDPGVKLLPRVEVIGYIGRRLVEPGKHLLV